MRVVNSKLIYSLSIALLAICHARATSVGLQAEVDRLHFVFNQPEYSPGDTAYFTGYLHQGKNQLVSKQIVSMKLFGYDKELIFHGRVLFKNGVGNSQIIIPQNSKPGNYQFISYLETSNHDKDPIFYASYISISNRDILDDLKHARTINDLSRLKIITDRDEYDRRSKVNVSITSEANGMKPLRAATVSVAVFKEELFGDGDNPKFISTLRVASIVPNSEKVKEISGDIDFPYYFMGKAFIESSGEAVPDSSKITFFLNESDFAFVVYTKPGGNFTFPLIRNFGNEKVFYRIGYKGNLLSDSRIKLYDTQFNTEDINSRFSDTLSIYGLYAKRKQMIDRSYHYFAFKENKTIAQNASSGELEADDVILLEKFESFASMEEVIINIVPSVRSRKVGDVRRIQVFLQRTSKYGINDPLYIVNGIMTDDTQYVLNLDPKSVKKIGVLRNLKTLSRFGDLGNDGILYIETNLSGSRESIISSANSLSVTGIGTALDFKTVVYNQDNLKNREPDLRSSLYWNPKADLDDLQSFYFYTSDDIGHYVIQVTEVVDGQLFLSTKRFSVTVRSE